MKSAHNCIRISNQGVLSKIRFHNLRFFSQNKKQNDPRFNDLNIQMISSHLRDELFGVNNSKPSSFKITKSIDHLKKHNLWNKEISIIKDVQFKLPKLEGKNIAEHFASIGKRYLKPYKELLNEIEKASILELPTQWNYAPGWTKYGKEGPVSVPYPEEDVYVFDIEFCVKEGNFPVMATALSKDYWYSWCSHRLTQPDKNWSQSFITPQDLISLESGEKPFRHKLVIGHNVSFDRSYVKEQYNIDDSLTKFADTLSFHMCISGLTGNQRAMKRSSNKTGVIPAYSDWLQEGTLNNLADVYQFYCEEGPLSKEARNIFVTGNLNDVRNNFQELMKYCANDVVATFKVLKKQLPLFYERFPHPITLFGMLEMLTAYLPVNESWESYLQKSQSTYEVLQKELKDYLIKLANDNCSLLENKQYAKDPWLWDLDWSTSKRKNSPKAKFPNWYCKLFPSPDKHAPELISTQMRVTPKLMRLTWDGHPVFHSTEHGWGYIMAKSTPSPHEIPQPSDSVNNEETELEEPALLEKYFDGGMTFKKEKKEKTLGPFEDVLPGYIFYRIPHKNGVDYNVGNPLSKDFSDKVADGTIRSCTDAQRILQLSQMLSYWKSAKNRILSQMVVWNDSKKKIGCILPRILAAGTVTRRAVEPTWLTASNAQASRVGSELKSMIQCPPGYHFVGADVDSQELWIAAVLGDGHFGGIHGCTAFGWMTLQGTKENGTDLHSKTASSVGISRNQAKVLNYARIYGAGKQFAGRFLKQTNHRLTLEECKEKASKIYTETKGVRKTILLTNHDSEDCMQIIKGFKKVRQWKNGSESPMFNKLEEIALGDSPKTPVLDCRISRALEPHVVHDNFVTSRVNWVVQSSAVDYLHLLLCSMVWLKDIYQIKGRFGLSVHDEVRYLVNSEDRYKAAYALQISNLLTRAMFSHQIGINDLPQSVAFFSSIEIDTVMRKDPSDNCDTPSNSGGLSDNFGIKEGESLNMFEILQKLTDADCIK